MRFLEIGVDRGGSLDAWSRYLGPEATIVGIDINPWCAKFDDREGRRHVRIGGQQDPGFLRSVVSEFGPFDVILDDGSHRPSHMNASFVHLFDGALVPEGTYVVEDLQTNYWRGFETPRSRSSTSPPASSTRCTPSIGTHRARPSFASVRQIER